VPHLTPTMTRFVLHWGEMGTRWGVNRTVAQVHALLFISPKPLHAEEIAETLSVARSNVSTSLRELQGWGIVRIVHVMGDRRDHFESIKDVWELYRQVMDERKRREIDPTLSVLRECVIDAEKSGPEDKYARERIGELLHFFETMTTWYEQVKRLPTPTLLKMVRLGEKIRKLLG
jgi:DNA-binding transcriptional regulator GbsR (MarR family)